MRRLRMSIRSTPDPIGLAVSTAGPVAAHLCVGRHIIGATDYEELTHKPSIEGHVLIGDSTLPQIGVGDITPQDIDRIIFG